MKVVEDLFTMDRIEKDFWEEMKKYPILTKEEENELGKRIKIGDKEAIEKMVLHNICLIKPIAKKYKDVSNRDFLDIIQDGIIGLIKAAEEFDITKNCRFSTIATPYICHTIFRQKVKTDDLIKKSNDNNLLYNKIKKLEEKRMRELGKSPSIEELATELGIPSKKIEKTLSMFSKVYYLNAPLNTFTEEESYELFEIIEDKRIPQVEQTVLHNLEVEILNQALEALTEREQYIVKQSVGMNGQNLAKSQRQIAKELNISQTRVGQIERKALQKLRIKLEEQQKFPQKKYTL